MKAWRGSLTVDTNGRNDCVDLGEQILHAMQESRIREGLVTVCVPGSTAAVTTIEHAPGVVRDLQAAIERLFPESLRDAHHETAGDDNGFSHIHAAFFGPSLRFRSWTDVSLWGRGSRSCCWF